MPEIESDLERATRDFRRRLLRQERRAASEMVRYYGQAWRKINTEIRELTRRYYAALDKGEIAPRDWLYRTQRLQSLRSQTEKELRRFAKRASDIILVQESEAIRAGAKDAPELVQAAFGEVPDGVRLTFNRLPTRAIENMIGSFQANSPVSQRLLELAGQGAQAVQDGLMNGLVLGQSADMIARAIRAELGGNLGKALTWARTETLRAYRKASGQTYQENQDIVKGWMWRSARNERTCAMCWAMDGEVFALEEELDDHPNGRCFKVPVPKTWRELGYDIDEVVKPKPTGIEAFDKLTDAQKMQVLGPAKFEAYQAGDLTLPDLVGRRFDPKWGSMRYERSMREVGLSAKDYLPEK